MTRPRLDVTIAAHAELADGTTDDRLLAEALVAAGARVRVAVWNDTRVDWSEAARTVIRSTWDYHLRPDEWFAWLETAGRVTRFVNPAAVLRWNSCARAIERERLEPEPRPSEPELPLPLE